MKTTKDLEKNKNDDLGPVSDDDFDTRKGIPLIADDEDDMATSPDDDEEEDDDIFNDIDE